MAPTVGPSGFPSQRRTLARACIDYILQSGPAGRVGRPWVGERLWAEQAVLEKSGSLVDTRSAQTACLDSLSPEEVQSSLALSDATLRRFHSWASKYFLMISRFSMLPKEATRSSVERVFWSLLGRLSKRLKLVRSSSAVMLTKIFFGALDLFNQFYFKMWEKTRGSYSRN